MAFTVDNAPSGLAIYQRMGLTTGLSSLYLSGDLNAGVSSVDYEVFLSSTSVSVAGPTSLTGVTYTSTGWEGYTGEIPIGPSGVAFPDWYVLTLTFNENNAAPTVVSSTAQPWGVGQVWGVVGQSNAEYMGPDGSVLAVGVSEPLSEASAISILDTHGGVLNWEAVDGSGCKSFLSSMSQSYLMPIAILQTAITGAPLFREYNKFIKSKTGYWLDRESQLYTGLVSGINEVGGTLEGIITHQGEAESFWLGSNYSMPEYKMTTDIYQAGFENLIARIREKTGKPKLPVLLGQLPGVITDVGTWANIGLQYDNVARAQVRIAEDDPYVNLVMTYDFDRVTGESFHLSSSGQWDFGQRLKANADFFLRKSSNYAGPRYTGATYVSSGEYELHFRHANGATDWDTNTKAIDLSGFHVKGQDASVWMEIEVTTKTTNSLKLRVLDTTTEPTKIGYNTLGLIQFPVVASVSANLTAYPRDNTPGNLPLYSWDGFVPLPKPNSMVAAEAKFITPPQYRALVDILIFQHDEGSTLLDDALDLFISSDTLYTNVESAGPFYRFLKAMSWSFYDINALVEQLSELVDIEQCPKEFFHYLAKIVGWKLISNDLDAWRSQLRQAIYIYKSKGTRSSFENALKLIFPDKSFDPTSRITELWESYLPKLLYYIIKTESPHIDEWSKEDSRDFDIPFSDTNPDWNARYLVDFILARLEEKLPGYLSNHSDFEFGDDKFEYRGSRENVVPQWEEERYYDTLTVIPEILPLVSFYLSGVKSRKGLDVPVSAVHSLLGYLDSSRYSEILQGTNNRWKFFTSSVAYPHNYDELVTKADSSKLHLLDYWSGKASTVSLELSTGDFDFSVEQLASNSKYAIDAISTILKDFKPFHVIVELLLYDDITDCYVAEDVLLSWNIMYCIEDINYLGADAGYATSGFAMSLGTGTLPRGTDNKMPDPTVGNSSLYTTTITEPRYSIRRRDREFGIKNCSFYKRDGFSMPVGWDFLSVSSAANNQTYPVSATGFLPKGFNPSSGEFFPTSSIIYSPDLLVTDTVSGIPVSAFYPVRDLTGTPDVDVTHYETRSNLNAIQEVFWNALQRKATADYQEEFLSSNPGWKGPLKSGDVFANGGTFEEKMYDFELSGPINRIYSEDYVHKFKKNLYGSHSDHRVQGGGNFTSHLLGPLAFNADMLKSGAQHESNLGTENGHYLCTSSANFTTLYNRLALKRTIVNGQFNPTNTAFGIDDKTYKLQLSGGFGASVESSDYVSGVEIGFGVGSQSIVVVNGGGVGMLGFDGSEFAIDGFVTDYKSLSIINRDSNVGNSAYIQFTIGEETDVDQSWVVDTGLDNALLPEYDYDISFNVRDSDTAEDSVVGVGIFIDDFHGVPYYFDWKTQTWKDIEHIVSTKRKDQPSLYNIREIYADLPVFQGNEVFTAGTEQYYDPTSRRLVQSVNLRNFNMRFNTSNTSVDETSRNQGHAFNYGGLHSENQVYHLRFVQTSNTGSFVTFRDFSIKNATYNQVATDLYMAPEEIPTVIEYMDTLAVSGLQSKDTTYSVDIHGAEGGSRLVYMEPGGYPSLSSTPQPYSDGVSPFTGVASLSAGIYEVND